MKQLGYILMIFFCLFTNESEFTQDFLDNGVDWSPIRVLRSMPQSCLRKYPFLIWVIKENFITSQIPSC